MKRLLSLLLVVALLLATIGCSADDPLTDELYVTAINGEEANFTAIYATYGQIADVIFGGDMLPVSDNVVSIGGSDKAYLAGWFDHIYLRGELFAPNSGSADTTWGNITGILSNQADLQEALGAKDTIHSNRATLDLITEAFTTSLKTSYDWLVTNITAAWKTSVDDHIASTSNPHSVTKAQVGLGAADNTSDASKPVSTAQQTALNLKVDKTTTVNGNALSANVTITDANISTSNVTTNDASTSKHGWLPILSGVASQYLNGQGQWATVSASVAWGGITGTLSNQTDLNTALSNKEATANKDDTGGYAGLTLLKINFKNVLNTFTSFFTNTNTAARTYTFQNRDGTIADDTDLLGKQATLVSGTNIKTINGSTVLGSGDLVVGGADSRLIVDAVTTGEQHDVTASVALTKVTVIDVPLTAGTYTFRYDVIYRSNQLTNGIRLAVNYSGTNGAFVWNWSWVDLVGTASAGAADQDSVLVAATVKGNFASRAKSSITRGTTVSVDTINADMYAQIEGVFVATGSGNLELWHGSELATAAYTTSVMIGTSIVVTKTK